MKGVFGAESFNQVPTENEAYAAIKALRDGGGPKGPAIAVCAAYEPGMHAIECAGLSTE